MPKPIHFAVVMFLAGHVGAHAQRAAAAAHSSETQAQQSEILDRVVAVVNQDVLLESDVEQEMRFAAFLPYSAPRELQTRQTAIERIIDRLLIEQQLRTESNPPVVTDEEVQSQIKQLRQAIPACARYHCATESGWQDFVAAQGFTTAEVEDRWRTRILVLKFVEQRFRSGIRISKEEINEFYQKTFIPQFAQEKAAPPPLDQVSGRIEEILLQRRVTAMLLDWLKSLREQGNVQILNPDDVPKDFNEDPSSQNG